MPIPPIRFGRYTLLAPLAAGGMAELFLAHCPDEPGSGIVVLKRILGRHAADPEFIRMFLDEVEIARDLRHENIVPILDYGELDGQYFLTMPYVEGSDLWALIEALPRVRARFGVAEAVHAVSAVCRGLEFAHSRTDAKGTSREIVHRDISPENVLASIDGELMIADFGIAKATHRNARTRVGLVKGKRAYMSPEMVWGKPVDRRHDVFSAGVVLWELLAGRPLFEGRTDQELLAARVFSEIERPSRFNPDVTEDLDTAVMKALASDRDDRYATARQFGDALEDWLRRRRIDDGRARIASLVARCHGETLARTREKLYSVLTEHGLLPPDASSAARLGEILRSDAVAATTTVARVVPRPRRHAPPSLTQAAAKTTMFQGAGGGPKLEPWEPPYEPGLTGLIRKKAAEMTTAVAQVVRRRPAAAPSARPRGLALQWWLLGGLSIGALVAASLAALNRM